MPFLYKIILHLNFSFHLSLASSDKTQNGEASSSWSYAKPAGTLASPPLPASARPPHPAVLTTLPASLETCIIVDEGKSQRYESLSHPSHSWLFSVSDFHMTSKEVESWSTDTALMPVDKLEGGTFFDRFSMWKVSQTLVFWWSLRFCLWWRVEDDISFPFLQMVLKINSIFEARRGKKRVKKVSQSTESSSGRGEV